jgi:hypothetical protein
MKIQMWFGTSVAVNVILLCALAYHLHHAFAAPDFTSPLIWCVFTNAPVTAEAYDAQLHSLRVLAGFDTNSVNQSR